MAGGIVGPRHLAMNGHTRLELRSLLESMEPPLDRPKIHRSSLPVSAVFLLLSGGCNGPTETTPPGVELESNQHLLNTPVGDPVSLLGRTVQAHPEGGWVIGERNADCQVSEGGLGKDERWNKTLLQSRGRVAEVAANVDNLGRLEAKYGREVVVQAKVSNRRTYYANLRGVCGDAVVLSVLVGSGERSYFTRRSGGVAGGGGPAQATIGGWQAEEEKLDWPDDQAWAFSVGPGNYPTAELRVEIPFQLTDGQEFTPQIRAAHDVWIVATYQTDEGKAAVLVPSEGTEVLIQRDQPVSLPTMRARLTDPRQDAYEIFTVYGFYAKGDYLKFAPSPGVLSPSESQAYAQELTSRLQDFPFSRWDHAEVRYRISPTTSEALP